MVTILFLLKVKQAPYLAAITISALLLSCFMPSSCEQSTTPIKESTQPQEENMVYYSQIADQLVRLVFPELDALSITRNTVVLTHTIDSQVLILLDVEGSPHAYGFNNLMIGVWDQEKRCFIEDSVYRAAGDHGDFVTWIDEQNTFHLLWTNTFTNMGYQLSSGVGYYQFDSDGLQPVYELPQIALDCRTLSEFSDPDLFLKPVDLSEEDFFWRHRMAEVTSDYGFRLYERNPNWSALEETQESQWNYVGFVPFL